MPVGRRFTHEDGQRISRHIQLLPQGREKRPIVVGLTLCAQYIHLRDRAGEVCGLNESQHALVIRHNRIDNLDLFAQ